MVSDADKMGSISIGLNFFLFLRWDIKLNWVATLKFHLVNRDH